MRHSILITAYNEEKLLCRCLESINKQSVKPLTQLLIDDGSTDATSEIAAKYGFPVHYISKPKYNEPHKNRCRAFITGFEKLEQDPWLFLLKVDSDIVLPIDYVEKLLETMQDREIGVASGASPEYKVKRGISNGAVLYRREALTIPLMIYGWDRLLALNAMKAGYRLYSHPTLRYHELRPPRVKRPPLTRLMKNHIENTVLRIYSEWAAPRRDNC